MRTAQMGQTSSATSTETCLQPLSGQGIPRLGNSPLLNSPRLNHHRDVLTECGQMRGSATSCPCRLKVLHTGEGPIILGPTHPSCKHEMLHLVPPTLSQR